MGLEAFPTGASGPQTMGNPYTGGGINWGGMASAAMPALGSLLTAGANISDIKGRTDAALKSMDSEVDTWQFKSDVSYAQLAELDRAVGDNMTERGLSALKAEARLRASAAMTGTTGGTTDNAIKDAYMQQSLDNAVTIREGRNTKVGILRGMQADNLNLTNRLESLASSITSPMSAGLSTLNSGLQGFNSGLNFMNTSQKEEYFNIG